MAAARLGRSGRRETMPDVLTHAPPHARKGPARPSGQPDRSPSWPGIRADGPAAGDRVPVHVPDRGLAAGVLQKDVGAPGAGSDRVLIQSGIGADLSAAD